MQSIRYKFFELFIIFILIPISFYFDYKPILKLIIGVSGFGYILYVLLKIEKIKFKIIKEINWKNFWKRTLINLLVIIIATTFFVWYSDKENLFTVVLNKPLMWILILCFYSIFSVYPQELIYRTFFFKRYKILFKNEFLFILMNAISFSLAHLLFKNTLVLFLTFIGGILFALSYKKTKSTFLVSVEHAIYGCWLFTVGMGSMLGFPS
ncbi:CPBP family intramembrane glutamic endopeptidase [uncultured Polaribacter sp.]|uniref:CPBP family intramembrane glutamic endopeptidase n=1 Tax=uncultured Polaribacter sp. TaxID=174711 RepID=UPI00261C9340|nr:CPBP family intramembrane glutamic endopeptidase [uncultured Polaribacter sp.]